MGFLANPASSKFLANPTAKTIHAMPDETHARFRRRIHKGIKQVAAREAREWAKRVMEENPSEIPKWWIVRLGFKQALEDQFTRERLRFYGDCLRSGRPIAPMAEWEMRDQVSGTRLENLLSPVVAQPE